MKKVMKKVMKNLTKLSPDEVAKLTPEEYEAWRRSLDPDVMGPDDQEVPDA